MAGRLNQRRILVTGAASGMGLAIARLFADEGASLALLDRMKPASARQRAIWGRQAMAATWPTGRKSMQSSPRPQRRLAASTG